MAHDKGEVIKENLFAAQVCVPSKWSDKEVLDWAKAECGGNWAIQTTEPERCRCEDHPDATHIVLLATTSITKH